jgi:hypothetical protein
MNVTIDVLLSLMSIGNRQGNTDSSRCFIANDRNNSKELQMKREIRLALLLLATTAVPAIAQNASPLCGAANFDATRNIFTVMNPALGAVNQQCFFTVYRSSDLPTYAKYHRTSFLVEGNYAVELSGGGGGGGGGASQDQGGGGGGAGAAPSHVVRYLAPGTYKMTIGTGGSGGSANGGKIGAGNPTSLTNADTGQLIAGFQGADTWQQHITAGAGDGRGGVASVGGSRGGDGGDSGPMAEAAAQSGGASRTSGYAGKPGEAGSESGRRVQGYAGNGAQANAGGGGGAGVGSGGAGETVNKNAVAGAGDLGGGGGGGRGGLNTADAGAQGGHGFIRLSVLTPLI